MQARFGLADIGAAFGELRRQADGNLTRGLRHGRVPGQLRMQGLRRFAHQQAESVDQLVLALLQIRQARFDGRNLGGGFSHVQVRRYTVSQAKLRQ